MKVSTSCSASGSSPRVRGLPVIHPTSNCQGGIIPARAGFTQGECRAHAHKRDHPRACGVYRWWIIFSSTLSGSSPRVRGLPLAYESSKRLIRIIPARAGFTIHRSLRPGSAEDHPRACGVYSRAARSATTARGSSPRVRGLLFGAGAAPGTKWIIPARAGFTGNLRSYALARGDHPRACGVYSQSSLR